MKKIFAIAVMTLLVWSMMAQGEKKGIEVQDFETLSYSDHYDLVKYRFAIDGKVKRVLADGKTFVALIEDTVQYGLAMTIDVESQEDALSRVNIENGVVNINDPNPSLYILHISLADFGSSEISNKSSVGVFSSELGQSMEQLMDACFQATEKGSTNKVFKMAMTMMMNSHNLSATLTGINLGLNGAMSEAKKDEKVDWTKVEKYVAPLVRGHADVDFHWGFNNWGVNPFSGLVGMGDPGYDLRTSFSSYQLSVKFCKPIAPHFDLGIGLGYESDIYKFGQNYVDYQNGTFTAIDTMMPGGYYSTRFVTRYVQMPLSVGWIAKRLSEKTAYRGLSVRLSVIPALGWCGTHTGLKHEFHVNGKNPHDQTNLKDAINPFKCDVRLDVDFGNLGIFLQLATMPVFIPSADNPTKIYPIKIGFFI